MKFNQAHGLPRGASIYCFFVDQYVKCWDTGGASRYIREQIFSGRVPIKVQFGLPMLFTALHYSFVVETRRIVPCSVSPNHSVANFLKHKTPRYICRHSRKYSNNCRYMTKISCKDI